MFVTLLQKDLLNPSQIPAPVPFCLDPPPGLISRQAVKIILYMYTWWTDFLFIFLKY